MSAGDWLLTGIAIVGLVPVATLWIETIFAVLPRRSRMPPTEARETACVVLIPAHNEENGIAATVRAVVEQLAPGDRVVVVADNCEDRTADCALAAGAEVLNRTHQEHRGKGFALEFGLKALAEKPPAVVVVLDADGRFGPNALEFLVRDALAKGEPIQAIYTENTDNPGPRERWSAFAMLFKNGIRPLGLHRLGLPCLLTGSGMAFPWQTLQGIQLGTANIVEDMQLGLDLAMLRHAPRLCPEAHVTAETAPNLTAIRQQRTRWEHGHLHTLLTQVPRLCVASVTQARCSLFALALELAVPPLSLLVLLLGFFGTMSAVAWGWFGGSLLPVVLLSIATILTISTIFLAWCVFGTKILPLKNLLLLPLYILWKIPIYLKLVVAPQKAWNRTERKDAGD